MPKYNLDDASVGCSKHINNSTVIKNPDGTISVYESNGNGTVTPFILTKECCSVLAIRDGQNYFFDLDQQVCKWGTPTNPCETPDSPIKIVLNPKGNDGSVFEIDNAENCGLRVDFDFLIKLNCEKLSESILNNSKISNLPQSQEVIDLNNTIDNKTTFCEQLTSKLNNVAQEFVNVKYSILCEDFPFGNTIKQTDVTTPQTTVTLNEAQKTPFGKTGFGSLAPMSFALPTRRVIFCLTEPDGLSVWQKILGANDYKRFLDGDITSYTTKQVVELYNQNEAILKQGGSILMYECETPFGYKTQLKKDLDALIDEQIKCNSELTTLKDNLNILTGDQGSNGCGSLIDYFENFSATMSIDVVNDDNTLTTIHEQGLFPLGTSSTIGSGNLYNYLLTNQTNSGFYVCGQPNSQETWASGCTPIYYTEFSVDSQPENVPLNHNVSSCLIVKNTLLNALFDESGIPSDQETSFFQTLSPNILSSEWLHFSQLINDANFISNSANKKLKLSINIQNNCGDFCVLIDEINLQRECSLIKQTSLFINESPGFKLTKVIDNKKSWLNNTDYELREFDINNVLGANPIRQTEYDVNDDRLVINTKEIDLNMNIASAVEYDVWCYLSDNPCLLTGGTITCKSECGNSNIDFSAMLSDDITKVKTIENFENLLGDFIDVKTRKVLSGYPTLRAIYDRYLNSNKYCGTDSLAFDYYKMDMFSNLITTYWHDLIEQVIPSTSLWGSVKVYTNTLFDQQKFKYKSYSSLFCNSQLTPFTPPSPINGSQGECQRVEVITSNVPVFTALSGSNYSQTFSRVCLNQMNWGSEFIGNVKIITGKGDDFYYNLCNQFDLCEKTAVWYDMQLSPEFIMNKFKCGPVSGATPFNFIVESFRINGTEYVTTPLSGYVSSATTNWVLANNSVVSGCTGSVTGLTYTNFVDLLNNMFTNLGVDYLAEVSLVERTPIDNESGNGMYLIFPSTDTFTIKTTTDLPSSPTLIYSNYYLSVENGDSSLYNYSEDVNYDCLTGEINE